MTDTEKNKEITLSENNHILSEETKEPVGQKPMDTEKTKTAAASREKPESIKKVTKTADVKTSEKTAEKITAEKTIAKADQKLTVTTTTKANSKTTEKTNNKANVKSTENTNNKANVKSTENTKAQADPNTTGKKSAAKTVVAHPDRQLTDMLNRSSSFTGPNDPLPTFLL